VDKQERKLVQRLKKIDRLKLSQILRRDDITVAYYCLETDELILFIDVVAADLYIHFNAWGKIKEGDIVRFTTKLLTRTILHELYHWGGLESSKVCDYLAFWFVWDKATASVVSSWLYPDETLPKFGVIDLKWEDSKRS